MANKLKYQKKKFIHRNFCGRKDRDSYGQRRHHRFENFPFRSREKN
jgi:hypothetical protein